MKIYFASFICPCMSAVTITLYMKKTLNYRTTKLWRNHTCAHLFQTEKLYNRKSLLNFRKRQASLRFSSGGFAFLSSAFCTLRKYIQRSHTDTEQTRWFLLGYGLVLAWIYFCLASNFHSSFYSIFKEFFYFLFYSCLRFLVLVLVFCELILFFLVSVPVLIHNNITDTHILSFSCRDPKNRILYQKLTQLH